jgi:hypothetical protein
MIAGQEPRHQSKLAGALFCALVVVVVGSLAGEALSYRGVSGGTRLDGVREPVPDRRTATV